MKILISGVCGFVGSTLARGLKEMCEGMEVFGFDNFLRPGSETNRQSLAEAGIHPIHADLRKASDIEQLPRADWVIDAAAHPSVVSGLGRGTSSLQLAETNLWGTINLLEFCKSHQAGFILLSSSRVYSIEALSGLKLQEVDKAFRLHASAMEMPGTGPQGITEQFSTAPPVSLYGAGKLASEIMALEYGSTFDFPVRVNRCGILAGAGQFGRPDQGICAYWILSWILRLPLVYRGHQGRGFQTRDCLHPLDLLPLISAQMNDPATLCPPCNVGGGKSHAWSLAQLSEWCEDRFGPHNVESNLEPTPFDIPWIILDATAAETRWNWKPMRSLFSIWEDIAVHATRHPEWARISGL